MRILVFSQAAWNTSNSFGNTATNWFEGWEDTHFFHFYARQQKPNTDIVEKYYNVSAVEILKKALKGRQAGRAYDASEIVAKTLDNKPTTEQVQIAKLHKSSNEIIYWGMEQVWRSRRWINKAFDAFVEEADPDIIFAFATSPYILEPAIKHIKKKKPSTKVILYLADDILTGIEQNAWYRRGYLKKGIDYCIKAADKLYGASVEMCRKYSSLYEKEISPLYKGCTFDKSCKLRNNDPIRLVYAGNLLFGRIDTLKKIIKALRVLNQLKNKAVLEVYSNTPLDKEKKEWFDEKNAFYMGARPYEEIKVILNEADIVLHVESFEKEQMEAVKYSFSTKIIDCLQSGSVVVGIGPSGIASIEYLRRVPGTIIIDTERTLEERIEEVLNESCNYISNADKTRRFAINNHSIESVRTSLRREFRMIINDE